jgi:3-phosphoshikimate 1-carboxyvinyltransferase
MAAMKLRSSPSDALSGVASVPGDKSISHRALIIGALAEGETRIEGLLESDDVLATARALQALGIAVERDGPGQWRVTGGEWRSPEQPIDCGNSGTAARLLIGAAAGFDLTATFTGDESLRTRPMRRVTEPLARMGARFVGGDRLPLTLTDGALGGIEYVNRPASAQVKSAILLAGLRAQGNVAVVEPAPSRDHSEILLAEFGADIEIADDSMGRIVRLGANRHLTARDLRVPGDPSSAAFPLVAAAIVHGSTVTVKDTNLNPLRTGLYEVLEKMGADVALSNERVQSGELIGDIRIAHAPLQPCHVLADRIAAMIDEIPALAVACAFADGESVIEGLAELRHKESDRLGAIVAGLAACGVVAMADGDTLRIFGRENVRGGGEVVTAGDHRIAMAFLTLGLAAERPVVVDGAEMIATSFPGFTDTMRKIGAAIDEPQ